MFAPPTDEEAKLLRDALDDLTAARKRIDEFAATVGWPGRA
jgi:hypothetical protein